MSEGAKNAKINVLIFDKPYPPEKTAMMRAVNWAILTGACNECRHRRKCSLNSKFKFPKRAPCVKKKAEYLEVKQNGKA